MSHHAPSELPSRRRLLSATAWSAPVVVAAAAAPAAVASAALTGRVLFDTTSAGRYVRAAGATATSASGTANVVLTGGGGAACASRLLVSFSSQLVPGTGYELITASNLTARAVNGSGYLQLQQYLRSDAAQAPGVRGQTLTVTFARPVRNLSFGLGGFTSGNGVGATGILFTDAAYLTSASTFTSGARGADVLGDGTSAAPWYARRFNVTDVPVTDADTVTNIRSAGPVSSFTLQYYSLTARASTTDFQGLFLSSMSFSAAC
ncbi:hypothetical protein [Pseudoclavibacter sp. RFBA6]|uniref:hypothetical protein n=1 Tax=Pseudoclavibacter sp. RFBA6 TaxID=2080573 RepID=UPI000CE91E26|nr:hypothetical protein [Pseudoclavibacter sp. RFBA6]PPG42690.1 hypothetical protein C5C17_02455 [Pseudoclavibacter sp. RFBA6]